MPSMLTITLTVSPLRSDVCTCMFYCIYQCNSKTYVFKTVLFMISLSHFVLRENRLFAQTQGLCLFQQQICHSRVK